MGLENYLHQEAEERKKPTEERAPAMRMHKNTKHEHESGSISMPMSTEARQRKKENAQGSEKKNAREHNTRTHTSRSCSPRYREPFIQNGSGCDSTWWRSAVSQSDWIGTASGSM
jgi:hypothetical protein